MVRRAIESVLAQTYRNWELIVVDDGSSDGTGNVLESLAGPLKYFYQENRGLASARNLGVKQSKGPLIALLDSDDWWVADKLRQCVDYLKQHPDVDVVYTPMKTVDTEGKELFGHEKVCKGGYLLNELFEDIFVHDPAAVFYRKVWERVGGFDESLRVCVGHNFWLRVAVEHKFGLIPEPLAIRTWSKESLTKQRKLQGQKIKVAMLEDFYLKGKGGNLLDPVRARRALSRAFYAAGKICMRNGEPHTGVHFLRRSLSFRPLSPKAWFFYLLGKIKI
jgi:glycosyltransferase involved in cell wall biosynthesis